VADGEGIAGGEALPVERVRPLFRAGPERDAGDVTAACRFLARETDDGGLEPATGVIDSANRCTALGEPLPQSARQQELVCLAAAHANCPRYLRGVLVAGMAPTPAARQPVSRAVIAASLVLAASLAASIGFLAIRGGFTVPLASLQPAVAVASLAPAASAAPTSAPTPTSSPSPTPTLAPTPSPSLTPTPTAPPTPAPTPRATRTPTPTPTSDRYAVLTKCPNQSDCWIYVIRSGDNLRSIANWFGVSFDRMMAMNPNLRTPIHAGDKLRIPTPTR
jgi:hypothetical protein